MPINFGNIKRFRGIDSPGKKGFGFLDSQISFPDNTPGEVFFHISTVKGKYPDLVSRLNADDYRDIRLWYEWEPTAKGVEANRIWKEAHEIPENFRAPLAQQIRDLWLQLAHTISRQFENLSVELLGQQEVERLAAERVKIEKRFAEERQEKMRLERERREEAARREQEERIRQQQEQARRQREEEELARRHRAAEMALHKKAIQAFCRERGIRTLLHFTRIENLSSILRHGLLGRETLSEQLPEETYIFNDDLRIDCCSDALCLSISFPNYRMFYRYRQEKPDVQWAIFLIKPDILWELDCAFCHTNAASNLSRFASLEERRSVEALKRMFDGKSTPRDQLGIPDYFPTDPQAEVLVLERISLRYITEIHVDDIRVQQQVMQTHQNNIPLRWNSEFFRPRSDWGYWKNSNFHNI